MEAVERWVKPSRRGRGVLPAGQYVDYASHSAQVDPILAELEGLLSELARRRRDMSRWCRQ